MKRSSLLRPRAFTLIELMTVVAIIAMLAAMGFFAMSYAFNKSREKDAVATIAKIATAVTVYKDDRGNYPRPAEDKETTTIDEESWTIGGAKMLYQVLSGDGDDAVKGGEKRSTGIQGSAKDEKDTYAGRIYLDTIVAPTPEEIEKKSYKGKPVASAGDSSYYVIDPWQHPYQYKVAERDKNGMLVEDVELNSDADYELWSYGTLKKPREGDADKQKWITSWGLK